MTSTASISSGLRREAIGAGEIDEVEREFTDVQLALFRLDGDARVVADALIHPREGVKERGLARVGIAEKRDGGNAKGNHVDFSPRPLAEGPG